MTDPATLLLVHGAWHGSWCWDGVSGLLTDRGRRVRTVELPTAQSPDKASLGVADDAAAVSRAIQGIDGPVVVVAHSYGGIPVTEVATDDRVQHIVYVAAFALDAGETVLGAVGGVEPDWWHSEDGLAVLDPSARSLEQLFYGDVPDAQAAAAVERLVPQGVGAFREPLTAAAWRVRPSTYVLTELDEVIPPVAQEQLAGRAGSTVVRIESSHSPFLSRPEELADILDRAGRDSG